MTDKYRPVSWISRFFRHRTLWPVISLCMLALVILLSPQEKLLQMNRLIQDFIMAAHGRELSGDVVIVAIDEKSIAALGRWPWRRALHAELLDRIATDKPRAIGLDVLFTEPEQTHVLDDAMLAASIQRNQPVVLPVFIQNQGTNSYVVRPLPAIDKVVAGLGVAQITVDNDGIVRNIHLREKSGDKLWDHFSVALIAAGEQNGATGNVQPSSMPVALNDDAGASPRQMLIPYAGGAGYFKRVSYLDVIQGDVPKDTFKDKYVLIGATAIGISDQYATPTSGKTYLMPGVEVIANITDALLRNIDTQPASTLENVALNLMVVALALIGFAILSPFFALLLTVILAIALFSVSYFSISLAGILFSPAIGMIGLLLIYPLWSWHRLSTATRFLTIEFESFYEQKTIFADHRQPFVKDFLDRRIVALEGATNQLRNLHRFTADSLNNMPYPTLITDVEGTVCMANQAAAHHFKPQNIADLVGQYMPSLIADVLSVEHNQPLISPEIISTHCLPVEGEAKDKQGRDLIVKCVPILDIDMRHTGWILSLMDVSKIRQTERDREEAFRFITHDIRSPLSSIISILELRRLQPPETHDALMRRLETYADNALSLADNFVNLSRAKSGQYFFENIDLQHILSEVVDEAWATGLIHNISIQIIPAEFEAYAMIDRHLLKRALANLISNAIKFSPNNAPILCAIENTNGNWDISIKDYGAGIPSEMMTTLFEPFQRLHTRSHPHIKGTGLGLAFVGSVLQRHGGSVVVESKVNEGSTFHLLIPIPS